MIRTLALHALVLSGMLACRQGEIVAGVSDSTFVATMTALTRINQSGVGDSASRAAARDSVLQSRGLTREDIERAARALEDDPDRAAALWITIGRAPAP
jgi:hypothetical protein